MSTKLNLGCGTDIREGWINLDSALLPGVTVVHDVNTLPLPFPDSSFDEILCQDIIEHIAEYVPLLKELHRILTPGGRLRIQVPHFSSKNNFVDPTHRRMFSAFTFDFFASDSELYRSRPYYFDFAFASLMSVEITFWRSSWIAPFINKTRYRQGFYEDTALSRLFPAVNIVVVLKK
ncbi:MAG: methyltransferase protein [Parcubacteria group bacterium]|nr:methyltransferase protein [Parcubacteria group bacterium]